MTLPTQIEIGKQIFYTPWIALVPRPSEAKETEIEAGIRDNGIYPILVWVDDDEKKNVIDGHTRLLLAKRLGITEIVCVAFVGTREEAEIAAVATNAIHRDWTRETRLATVSELFSQKWAYRKIARAIGTNPGSVHRDLVSLGLIEKSKAPEPEPDPETEPPLPDDLKPPVDDESPAEAAAPSPKAAATPREAQAAAESATSSSESAKPTPSVADRRQASIDTGKAYVQKLTRLCSELKVFNDAETHLDKLMGIFVDCDKGCK